MADRHPRSIQEMTDADLKARAREIHEEAGRVIRGNNFEESEQQHYAELLGQHRLIQAELARREQASTQSGRQDAYGSRDERHNWGATASQPVRGRDERHNWSATSPAASPYERRDPNFDWRKQTSSSRTDSAQDTAKTLSGETGSGLALVGLGLGMMAEEAIAEKQREDAKKAAEAKELYDALLRNPPNYVSPPDSYDALPRHPPSPNTKGKGKSPRP